MRATGIKLNTDRNDAIEKQKRFIISGNSRRSKIFGKLKQDAIETTLVRTGHLLQGQGLNTGAGFLVVNPSSLVHIV